MSRADDLLGLLSQSERLESLPRTGWLTCGVAPAESVAAHIYHVTLVAMWLAEAVAEDVDTAEVLRIALLHDLSEAVLTDIPSPAKKRLGSAHVRETEAKLTHEILENMPDSWHRAVDQYIDQTTLEAKLVKAADRIQMLAKSCQYRWQNRGNTERFWNGPQRMDKMPPVVNEIIERLEEHFQAGTWYGEVRPASQ